MAKKGEEHVPKFFRWGLCLQEVGCFSIGSKDNSVCSLNMGGLINWVFYYFTCHYSVQSEWTALLNGHMISFVCQKFYFVNAIFHLKNILEAKSLWFSRQPLESIFSYSLRKDLDQTGKEVWLYNGTYWQLRKDPGFANTDNLHLW